MTFLAAATLAACLCLSHVTANSNSIGYDTGYFTQQLDHFDFSEDGSFQQRYLINTTSWAPGGPIFFYTGNEGDITLFAENTGAPKQCPF
jgi:hypothetical protein